MEDKYDGWTLILRWLSHSYAQCSRNCGLRVQQAIRYNSSRHRHKVRDSLRVQIADAIVVCTFPHRLRARPQQGNVPCEHGLCVHHGITGVQHILSMMLTELITRAHLDQQEFNM